LKQIPSIIKKLSSRSNINLYKHYLENLDSMLPNRPLFLDKYNIREEEYLKVKNSFLAMHFQIWSKIIEKNPIESLQKIVDLSDHYLSRNINFHEEKLEDVK